MTATSDAKPATQNSKECKRIIKTLYCQRIIIIFTDLFQRHGYLWCAQLTENSCFKDSRWYIRKHRKTIWLNHGNDKWTKWEVKEVEIIKKKKKRTKQILEGKNKMNEIKNAVECINSWMDQAKERICENKHRIFEIIWSEENNKKEWIKPMWSMGYH